MRTTDVTSNLQVVTLKKVETSEMNFNNTCKPAYPKY